MDLYSVSLPDVTPLKLVTGKANYGIGFLTAFVGIFCSLFGLPNNMFADKLKKAEELAMQDLNTTAKAAGADGVMDVRCQIDGLSFLVSGTAYKLSPKDKTNEDNAKSDTMETTETSMPTENFIEGTIWVCGKCKTKNLLTNNVCWHCNNPK